MTHYERFAREVYWPMMMKSIVGMDREQIERVAPGISCSGFVNHLLNPNHGKPVLEEITFNEQGRGILTVPRYWKNHLETVEEVVSIIRDRVRKGSRAYYASPGAKSNRAKLTAKKKRAKNKQKSKLTAPVDLAAVISGKPTVEMINAMKAEVLDLMLKGPGVREAILLKLKITKFAWE